MISEYLITSNSIRRWKTPDALQVKNFYLLRFARIAPLMFLLLLVLSALHLARVPHYVVSEKTGGLGRALMAALTFQIGYLEATRDYLPGNWDILWSLSVEEMFYLFFPVAARLLRKKTLLLALLAAFVVAGPFARMKAFNPNPVWREYSYLGGMDAIALGCITAMVLPRTKLSRRWVLACGLLGAALMIFSLCFSLYGYKWGLGRGGLNFTILSIGVCLVIAAASESRWRAPRILLPLLVLGQKSYEVYLTHMFVVITLFAVFVHFGAPMRAVPWLFVSVIVAAGLLGWAVSHLYAEPMNRLIRARSETGRAALGAAVPEVD